VAIRFRAHWAISALAAEWVTSVNDLTVRGTVVLAWIKLGRMVRERASSSFVPTHASTADKLPDGELSFTPRRQRNSQDNATR
jgi:hypothetical protein